jgi:hypothetical protein
MPKLVTMQDVQPAIKIPPFLADACQSGNLHLTTCRCSLLFRLFYNDLEKLFFSRCKNSTAVPRGL